MPFGDEILAHGDEILAHGDEILAHGALSLFGGGGKHERGLDAWLEGPRRRAH